MLAPSRQILEKRLRARSEDPDAVIARRLHDAASEIRNYKQYDYVVINDDLERSAQHACGDRSGGTGSPQSRMEEQIRPILETFRREGGEVTQQMEHTIRNNAHCTIPDDWNRAHIASSSWPPSARGSLQGGARPSLPTSSKKATVIAAEEVRRGLVKYELTPLRRKSRPLSKSSPESI